MTRINVLIADDHKIFRDGIRSLLSREKDMHVVADVPNGREVLEIANKEEVDVVIMDIDMGEPNGVETTALLKKEHPAINVLILSMLGVHEFVVQALENGATGYLLKNAGKDEVLTAIRCIAKGDSYFSREVSAILIEALHHPRPERRKGSEVPVSARELEVLKLIAQEYSNPEIADKLFISIRTVDTHKRNLLEKIGVKNTAGLVKYALSKGLIDDGHP